MSLQYRNYTGIYTAAGNLLKLSKASFENLGYDPGDQKALLVDESMMLVVR